MKLRSLAVTVLFFLNLLLSAQDMLGLMSSNYAGIYGISVNPSTMAATRLYMDYNLIGAQGFLVNNYVVIQREEFITLVWDRTFPSYYTSEGEPRDFNIDRSAEMKNGFQNLKIMGPSGLVVKGRHAFGITSSYRTAFSFQDLPPEMAIFLYEGIDYEYQHNINYEHDHKIKTSGMGWTEIGLSYAWNFHRYRWNYWSAGITVKPLFGNTGFYTAITDLEYFVHNDDSASIYDATFEFGMSLPLDYETDEFYSPFKTRGVGIGFDLGITFQNTEKGHSTTIYSSLCEPPFEEYNYRIGFSILDMGFIKFKQNAIYQSYTNTSTEWYKPYDTIGYTSIKNGLTKLENYFQANAEIFESDETFTLYLPPALSLQAELKLRKYIYLNMTTFYGLKLGDRFLYRPSVFSFSARYETPRWEISLPLSVYEWQFSKPRLGIYLRYGNLFIGSDRLNLLLGNSTFNGMDLYGGIRLNLSNMLRMNFIKGYCGFRKMYNIETFDYRNF
jgi:hypothetical protein